MCCVAPPSMPRVKTATSARLDTGLLKHCVGCKQLHLLWLCCHQQVQTCSVGGICALPLPQRLCTFTTRHELCWKRGEGRGGEGVGGVCVCEWGGGGG
jgi:hypothetical protein